LPENLSDELFDDWRVALGVRWSVFDGGRRRGQIGQLESQRAQLDWQREDLERQVALELEQAYTGYETALASWTAATAAAAAAREASRVAGENYREGVALQADLLDAQDQEQRADLVEIEAYYEAWIQAARLQRALGRLPTDRWGEARAAASEE
jgi:outer membrane protein TolC